MTVQKGISTFSFIGICGALLFATLPLWFALWPETLGVTAVDLTAHIPSDYLNTKRLQSVI